jgi:signal peptidase
MNDTAMNATPNKWKHSKLAKHLRSFGVSALILGIGISIILLIPIVFKRQHFVIVSGSMSPVIEIGDIVIVNTGFKYENLNPDDIIAFKTDAINNDGTEEVVVHYIAEINVSGTGERTYLTKNERDTAYDDWVLTDEDIIGVYVNHIPKLGRFLLFTQSTFGKVVIIVDLLIIFYIISLIGNSDKKKKEVRG